MENLQENKDMLLEKAMLIELKPVLSSNICGMGYDESNQLLKVAFRNKNGYSTYLYENVDTETYNTILKADSVGKAVSEHIIKQKEKHKYTKL